MNTYRFKIIYKRNAVYRLKVNASSISEAINKAIGNRSENIFLRSLTIKPKTTTTR